MVRVAMLLLSATIALAPLPAQEAGLVESGGFRLPAGFECRLYADDDLAHDISCMIFDSRGRVVVSGPGYIKTLLPGPSTPDTAVKAERAVLFSDRPKSGAQGLCFVGNDLYASGDGAIWKFTDADGDGVADGPPQEFVSGLDSGGEHGVHNIIQGPDGWLYIIGGNDSGISEKHNTIPTAPIDKVIAGAILRVSLDGKQREVIAHGFRNPYDLCFNSLGSLFTWDSDSERVQHLPFYTPCRVFDVGLGRHHGWVNAGWQSSWGRPQWWPDVVDRMIEVGRGSPTGIRSYRHRQFPEKYRDGLFFACWTFGRIYFTKPERRPPHYTATHELFLEATGNAGFSPTSLAIAPDGSLMVSTGGRKTKGGVYRISWTAASPIHKFDNLLDQVLLADQPDAAWSRAQWVPLARSLGAAAFEKRILADTDGKELHQHVRALGILSEVFRGKGEHDLPTISPRLVAHGIDLRDKDYPRLEQLRRLQIQAGDVLLQDKGQWHDGYVAAKGGNPKDIEDLSPWWEDATPRIALEFARVVAMTGAEPENFWETLNRRWTAESSVEDDLHYLIVAARREKPHTTSALPSIARAWLGLSHKMQARQQFPSRFWAEMVGAAYAEMLRKNPALAGAVMQQETFNLAEHALFVFPMDRASQDRAVAALSGKAKVWTPELVRLVGDSIKSRTLEIFQDENRTFASRTERNVFLLEKLRSDPVALTLVETLVKHLAEPSLRDTVLLALPEFAFAGRAHLAQSGLDSFQPSVVQRSLRAVLHNSGANQPGADGRTSVRLLQAARRFEGQKDREALVEELLEASAQRLGNPPSRTLGELETAARKKFPEQAALLTNNIMMDLEKERARWSRLDVSRGSASEGKVVFEQRQCARCHTGGSRLGPELKGVTTRWNVPDLFLHTVDPSRQISPTWEGETFTLKDGRQFTGRAVYDSPEAILVQTTPDETVRITGTELQSRRKAEVSLMPPGLLTGLLTGLTDQDLANLHAYLRELE